MILLNMVVALRTSCSFKVYEGQVFRFRMLQKHYKTCRCEEIRFFAFRSLSDKTDFRDSVQDDVIMQTVQAVQNVDFELCLMFTALHSIVPAVYLHL